MNFINTFNGRQDSWRAGCVSTLMQPVSCASQLVWMVIAILNIDIDGDTGRIRVLTHPARLCVVLRTSPPIVIGP